MGRKLEEKRSRLQPELDRYRPHPVQHPPLLVAWLLLLLLLLLVLSLHRPTCTRAICLPLLPSLLPPRKRSTATTLMRMMTPVRPFPQSFNDGKLHNSARS
jgi:hypothetical protein